MRNRKPGWFTGLGIVVMLAFVAADALALEVNDDGRTLITEAAETYGKDIRERPRVSDPAVVSYVNKVANKLLPEGKTLPSGVTLSVTVIEAAEPELFSYADGHIVMTTALLYAMKNEAQLAAVLSHEVAHVAEGYYIDMHQQIKAAERRQRNMAVAGAMLSGLMDVAVDYAADYRGIEETEKLYRGEASYGETMKKMATIEAARSGYYSMKDVVESIPSVDESGARIDPRQQFEPVADAQGLHYLALAGYDAGQARGGWAKVAEMQNKQARERERMLGPMAQQISQMNTMMEMNVQRMRQSMGSSGLVQTIGVVPHARSEFVGKLTGMKEVKEAAAEHGSDRAAAPYRSFISRTLMPKAETALNDGRYDEAKWHYALLHDAGIESPGVSYGLAKSSMGDFAFGANEAEKRNAESLYRTAIKQNKRYGPAYKGLGELYEDWDRFEEAVGAYSSYLNYAPKSERRLIERKIKMLKRKASR